MAVCGCLCAVRVASAQAELSAEPVEEPPFVPKVGSVAGAGFSVEGYVGMTAYHSERALKGHGVTGGIARARASYVTVGGFAERADEIEFGRWEAFGGFAGVRLPFANWVDFEGSVGGGSRTHAEDDERYNSGKGYEWTTPFAMLRFGLSDRSSSDAPLALRVGFEVFGPSWLALRFPIVAIGALAVPLTWLFGRLLYSDLVGLAAAVAEPVAAGAGSAGSSTVISRTTSLTWPVLSRSFTWIR